MSGIYSFRVELARARRYSWALRGIGARPRRGWEQRAGCAGRPLELFFGGRIERVEALCSSCPVRLDCIAAEHEVEAGAPRTRVYGTRGGTTAVQRWDARREIARCARLVAEGARTA